MPIAEHPRRPPANDIEQLAVEQQEPVVVAVNLPFDE
jgi:hypothetical protein